jgi:hypothetical protein
MASLTDVEAIMTDRLLPNPLSAWCRYRGTNMILGR